jgi:dephospho-CoA kinase
VIAAQRRWMNQVFDRNAAAVAVVESALIFEVERDARDRGESETVLADWRRRLDRIVVVTAPEGVKIARYVARVCPTGTGREAAEADARLRLARQIPDAAKAARADYILENEGDKAALRVQVEELWQSLQVESNKSRQDESLK